MLYFLLVFLRQPIVEANFTVWQESSLPANSEFIASAAGHRRLGVITNDLPTLTAVRALLGNSGPWCDPSQGCTSVNEMYAGMNIISIELKVGEGIQGDTFQPSPNGKLRIVPSSTTEATAGNGACKSTAPAALLDASVSSPWDDDGSTVTYDAGKLSSTWALRFLMGGLYKVCYSDDGSFGTGHADVAMVDILVKGLFDNSRSCTASGGGCLVNRKHYCYVLKYKYNNADNKYTSTTSCTVDLSYSGSGVEGTVGKGSWSAAFDVTYEPAILTDTDSETHVKVASVIPQQCTTFPAYFLCPNGGHCDIGVNSVEVQGTTQTRRLPMPVARPNLGPQYFKAMTVAACYCPDYDGCNGRTDFLQQVGIMHYFATKVCGHGDDGFACNLDYTGAAAPFRFSVRIECPGDACKMEADGGSRMKIVAKNANNDLPFWDSNSACASAVHGWSLKGWMVMPADLNLDVSEIDGGPREDFKLWNFRPSGRNTTTTNTMTTTTSTSTSTTSTSTMDNDTNITYFSTFTTTMMWIPPEVDTTNLTTGFFIKLGHNFHERVSYDSEESFDVCFCNDNCDIQRNWFKTGEIRSSPIQLVSAASNISATAIELTLQYAGQPGILGFYRPPNASNQLGMLDGGMLKLVEDNDLIVENEDCVTADYSTNVTNTSTGFSPMNAGTLYRGTVAAIDPYKLVFNDGNLNNAITVKRAGFLAVCYCPRTVNGQCHRNTWVLAARLTIKGPLEHQNWLISTHVTFRLAYEGFGLSNTDKIRIIPAWSRCSQDDNNPNGATVLTGLRMQCPYPCVEIGAANQVINGDFESELLADDRFECNKDNANCRQCDIKSVQVLNETHTQIMFEFPPGIREGDMLTLGDNIICDPAYPGCTVEQLATLKGRFRFADRDDNTPVAPDSYTVGHRFFATSDKRKWVIEVGWPEPAPRFLAMEDPSNNYKRGRWTRHSSAITREEIMGTVQNFDMKVCWKFGGPLGSYVAQAGTLTLKDATPMANCLISMTSTVKRRASPVILSWRTSDPDIVPRYSTVTGATKLRILWTDVFAVDPKYVTGLDMQADPGGDELKDAKQAICGSLFKEMWSSDQEFGFPLPRGCYHRAFGTAREIFIVFDAKNGLRAAQDYQLVLNAATEERAKKGSLYAEITTMDDVEKNPYNAIERGLAPLKDAPQSEAAGTKGVMFLKTGGFRTVRGDDAGLYELKPGKSWFFELRGEPIGGGIRASSVLRIFLWPLTMWNVDAQCSAICHPFDDANPCGVMRGCSGESIVPGFHRNFLKLKLPLDMTTAGALTYPTIQIDDIKLPPGGIFPMKFPAQISKSDDTKPHYVEGVGHNMHKAPADGQTYARLVNVFGDGDHRPFRNDIENVLYAHIVLGATLFAGVQTGDASFTLTLPPGYECVRKLDWEVEDDLGRVQKTSKWRAENNLTVFGSKIPQGRGTPDEGSGKRGWSVHKNTCTFTLAQMSVVYAYASLYVRITVNNPPESLKAEDPSNKWYLSLKAKGLHGDFVHFPTTLFKSTEPNYASSSAVLGRMDAASIVPMNFGHSMYAKPSELYIFFQTEQNNRVLGFIRLASPSGFKFDTAANGGCESNDLPESYYTLRKPGSDTYRLPGIVNCMYSTTPMNMAQIKLEGMLRGNAWYGFSIGVKNTVPYRVEQQDEWKIFTLTEASFRVDGTPIPVKLAERPLSLIGGAPDANKSFGVYRAALQNATVLIRSLVSYSLFGLRTVVTLRPLRLPFMANTTLRILAPSGFLWDFAANEFRSTPNLLSCVTMGMPGGVPEKAGNMLLWKTNVVYQAMPVTYGFSTFVRVPEHSPTASTNAFIIEFGFHSNSSVDRIAAATVPIQPDPGVSSVEVTDTHLIFQLYTETVNGGSALVLHGPSPNIHIAKAICTADLSPAATLAAGCADTPTNMPKMLPVGVICNSSLSTDGGMILQIIAGATSKIWAGDYRFRLKISKRADAAQAQAAEPNFLKASSPCGLRRCWTAKLILNIAKASTPWSAFRQFTLMGPMSLMNQLRSPTEVPALSDANVDYSRNLIGVKNNLTFTFRTVSAVPAGGVVQITGPEGFDIDSDCIVEEPAGVRGSPYYIWSTRNARSMLPNDVTCTSYPTAGYTTKSEVIPGKVDIILKAGYAGIPPRLYRFQIKAKNPKAPMTNPAKPGTPCGFRWCWSFRSLEHIDMTGALNPVQLDVPTSVASFWINRHFLDARMVNLTWPQILATGQDNRPLHTNPIVFAFKLDRAAVYAATFKVRAPLGYVFREECLSDIETNGSKVFGTEMPPEYKTFDQGSMITSCRGEGPDAEFHVHPGTSKGLQRNMLYVFRIAVLYNAPKHPVDNHWYLDYAQESSLPLEGFQLWTFKRTSLHGVSWARTSSIYTIGAEFLRNAVSFTLRPYNTVRGAGMKIKVTAPPQYRMVETRLECKIIMQKLDLHETTGDEPAPMNFTDISSLLSPQFVRWGESDIKCRVDESDKRILVAEVISDMRELLSGHDYQLTVFVNNPKTFPPWQPAGLGVNQAAEYPWTLTPMYWKVETEASPRDFAPYFRDLYTYPSEPVIQRLVRWSVINFNEVTETQEIVGKKTVPNVQFFIMLAAQPNAEENIYIEAPLGFNLSADPTEPSWKEAIATIPVKPTSQWVACNNFRWQVVSREYAVPNKTSVMCNGRWMLISLLNVSHFTGNAPPLSFTMDVVNAVKTPHVTENHWICRHRDVNNATIAEEALVSWPVRPQLEDVMLTLTGANQAEQATSNIEIYFTPVSDASELVLEAKLPVKGWSFAGAKAVSLGHEVVPEIRNNYMEERKVRITCTLFAGLPVIMQLTGVTLGYWGGQTLFDLTTKLGNGEKKDERLGFITGFRLPGRVAIVEKSLKNMFQQDPLSHPVPSLWTTRMTETAEATFKFTITQEAERGTALRIRAPPYIFLSASIANIVVFTESIGYGEVVLRLNDTMPSWNLTTAAYQAYTVVVVVETPAQRKAEDAMWRFEILDSDILPVNTNDALEKGFDLVAPIEFGLYAPRSPPMAEIQVEMTIDPKGLMPTEFLMVAPKDYNFTDNCLHDGGEKNEIQSCVRTTDFAGRQAAILTVKEPGLVAPVTDLVIKVVCPGRPQAETSFNLQARSAKLDSELGWGEVRHGPMVKPMPEYGVIYSGIPLKENLMVVYFRATIRLDPGGKLRVGYPEGYIVNCDVDNFRPMSLTDEPECVDHPDHFFFEVELPSYISPGMQCFGVTVQVPDIIRVDNNFSILNYEPSSKGGKILDGVTTVPGMKPQTQMEMEGVSFNFGLTKPLQTTRVSLGFKITKALPAVGGPTFTALVIRVPPIFEHQVTGMQDIIISSPSSLPLLFDENDAHAALVKNVSGAFVLLFSPEAYKPQMVEGEYRIQFPVLVPTVIPPKNVYSITLCGRGEGEYVNHTYIDCLDEHAPTAYTSFPYIGFTMGQAPSGTLASVSSAIPAVRFAGFWIAFGLISFIGAMTW